MKNKSKTGKALCVLLASGMLAGMPSIQAQAAVISSNATDKIAVTFHADTAYSAGDYVIYNGEMYICTEDTQGTWENAEANFMQITKNRELGTQAELAAVYDAAKDPSEEKSLMGFAANMWQKLKIFLGMEHKEEVADVSQYKNASVSAKLNFLQQQNQQLDQNVANLQGWITQSFQSVSNGKSILASTITDRGVQAGAKDTFQQLNQAVKDLALLQYNNGQKKGKEDGLKEGYQQGYDAGIIFADGRVNENSASYQQGLGVFQPKVWDETLTVDKNGPDKEPENFNSSEGVSSNHIDYSYSKSFAGHQILAVHVKEEYNDRFGNYESEELVCMVGGEYMNMWIGRNQKLHVFDDHIYWGDASFNIIDNAYDEIHFTVVYM